MEQFIRLVLTLGLTLWGRAAGGMCAVPDRDCAHFPNRAAAQAFYLLCDPARDPHDLDRDHDGLACEALHR